MRRFIFLLCFVFLFASCATFNPSKEVFKEKASYNSKKFSVSGELLYQALIKTIYSHNFIIEKENKEEGFILAKRCFQKGKRHIVLLLQAKIIPDENKSTLYLNALQTTERLFVADRTRFFLWIIPLPGGGGKEASRIKEEERVIENRGFYQKFFKEIEKEVANLRKKLEDKEKKDKK